MGSTLPLPFEPVWGLGDSTGVGVEQCSWTNLQRLRQSVNALSAEIVGAAPVLDSTEIGWIDPGRARQFIEREPQLFTDGSDTFAETLGRKPIFRGAHNWLRYQYCRLWATPTDGYPSEDVASLHSA